ncbi:MAG: sugar phosphate isomerase/epimerase [Spirochaetaceae bacterium]|nr:MAG: sugar phosphate isomerase/epimerase [Spirochaetaceae bacterium]
MKIGVSSYSFSASVKSGAMRFIDIPAKAKELGFEVIEFSTITVPPESTLVAFAAELAAECRRVGIEIGNYTIKADFINGCDVPPEKEVERLRGELEIAQILGSPSMRHDATWRFAGTFDQAVPTLADGCRKVAEIGSSMKIRTMVENHGLFAQDSDRMEKLVAGVDHPNFGILVDMGNFLCADEDPTHAVGRIAPFASHLHAKDFHVKAGTEPDPGRGWFRTRGGNYLRGAIIGHGVVPVRQCLEIMKRAGYTGTVSIEFEGIEDPVLGLSIGLENLKRYLAEIS